MAKTATTTLTLVFIALSKLGKAIADSEPAVVNSICSTSFLPSTFDLGLFLPGFAPMPHPRDFLVQSYRFSCEGLVTHWEAYTVGGGAHPIEFQVWRERVEMLQYNLVGINSFPEATPINGKVRLQVPEGEQIQVSPGDFVGVSSIEGNETDPFRLQMISGYYIDYSLMQRGHDSPPQLLRLVRLSGTGGLCFLKSENPTNFTATPLINAVVNVTSSGASSNPSTMGSIPTVSPTLSPMVSPTSTQPLLIATVILGALLLTLLIILLLTLALFCCYVQHKRREYTAKQEPPTQHTTHRESPLTTNPAYNSATGREMTLSPNQAYDDRTGEDSAGTEPYYSRIVT